MDFHVEQEEASRLKQILFPRKTKASRSTVKSVFEMGKENAQKNRPVNIRNQLNKLKKGMQAFLDKQDMSPDNYLATPRECLEIIKLMSDSLQNYGEEIQEAAKTLIESIPQCIIPITQSKYFVLHLKFNFLGSSFFFMKRRILSNAFTLIKQENQQVKQIIQFHESKDIIKKNRRKLSRMLYLSYGFNSWRTNLHKQRKQEAEEHELIRSVQQEANKIRLLSDESQMIVWLQKKIQSDSDVCEILILSQKNYSLRSYITINPQDALSSVFQTVEDHQLGDQRALNRGKIKRLQFNLDHSLTRICLVKKQPLRIEQIRRDPDYNKLDNITATHGLSSRQMMGGAIFTPILNQNGQPIGIVRQYYFDKPGTPMNYQLVAEVGRILERGIRTNQIIQTVKQKSEGIRKQYFLKSIQLMNEVSCQQKIQEIDGTFQRMLITSFPIKSYKQYTFETVNLLGERPKFIITTDKGTQVQHIQLLSALGKMHQSNCSYVFEENILIIKTLSKAYVLDLLCSEEGEVEFVPVPLVKHLFEHKQACNLMKIEQKKIKQIQDQKSLQKEAILKQEKRRKEILDFCLNCPLPHSVETIIINLQTYCDHFLKQNTPKICFRLNINDRETVTTNNKISYIVLHENSEFKLILNSPNANQIPQQDIDTISNLANYLVNFLLKPNHINTNHLNLIGNLVRSIDDPEKSILQLLQYITKIEKAQIQVHTLKECPFEQAYFLTYVQKSRLDGISDTNNLIKVVRKYGQMDQIQTQPLHSIILINGQLLFRINCFIQMKNDAIEYISNLLKEWNITKQSHHIILQKTQKYTNLVKGLVHMQTILIPRLRNYFGECKKNTKPLNINPHLFERYISKRNMEGKGQAFQLIKSLKKQKSFKLNKAINLMVKTRLIGIALGGRSLFYKWKQIKNKERNLQNITKILNMVQYRSLQIGFTEIHMRRYIVHTNIFYSLQTILRQKQRNVFQKIQRFCRSKMYSELTEGNSDCSNISKYSSFVQLASKLQQKYPQYQVFIELRNGNLLKLQSNKIQFFESLPLSPHTQFLQFLCSSKSQIKHVIWLIPHEITISLLQKHYLQALSKSVEESFKKFTSKSQLLFFLTNHAQHKVQSNNLRTTWTLWRNNVLRQIKNQEYKWRQSYYETNVQVQNLKSIQKQHKRQQEQREQEMKQLLRLKSLHQRNISNHRHSIVHLQVSSRNLEEQQVKKKYQRNREQIKTAFQNWRFETKLKKQIVLEDCFKEKTHHYGFKCLEKSIKYKEKDDLRSGFKMILIKCADAKAKMRSENKKMEKKGIQDRDFNRLMTFQDQFENDVGEKSRDISIIPISFKQFEASKKQNINISEEEARKMNQGAYKLNPKTLKFLKRMGKIGNQ